MATVLVVGATGGREHALAWALSKSPKVGRVLVSPGNGGTVGPKMEAVNDEAVEALTSLDLCVVGPEAPLVAGLADAMRERGFATFGPSAKAAVIEASKAWSKEFMRRHDLPTAEFKVFKRSETDEARSFIEASSFDVVVKASGLAAGKGVLVPPRNDKASAARAFEELASSSDAATDEILVEERLEGPEISLLAWCDGTRCECMPPAQDHKRASFGDRGKNTGGMGAYAPSPAVSQKALEKARHVMRKAVTALRQEGRPFVGALYGGFMLVQDEPYLLEFNCRFGDPETQVLVPLLASDCFDVMLACARGRLCDVAPVQWRRASAATVVVASKGYPDAYEKGKAITSLPPDSATSVVFHAGTQRRTDGSSQLVTSGGRVVAATAVAPELKGAIAGAYVTASRVRFDGACYRGDVGRRCLDAPVRIAVLGSTNGTSFQPVLDAVREGRLTNNASIEIVVSNKESAGILEKARRGSVTRVECLTAAQKEPRRSYDARLTALLRDADVELVLLIGWMRILSPEFVDEWRGRCLNVHPSLLPDYAGGMDLEVHASVLRDGQQESGCTVHLVTEDVDGGAVVAQAACAVDPGMTPQALKDRVQPMEGPLLIEAIRRFAAGDAGERFVPRPDLLLDDDQNLETTRDDDEVTTYRSAGVDIDAGNALVERIKPLAAATKVPGAFEADLLGGFGAVFDLDAAGFSGPDVLLVSGTDGVGTKLKLANEANAFEAMGVDLVAMCANDVATTGAQPLYFLDYYATGKLDVDRCAAVVAGVARGCAESGCALIGGETAEMPGVYRAQDYDVAGFCVGAVRRGDLLPKLATMTVGDVLLALPSTGLHANGFSLVRKLLADAVAPHVPGGLPEALRRPAADFFAAADATPEKKTTLAEALLAPTALYAKPIQRVLRCGLLGAAHITGGGLLENLPRVLPDNLAASLDAPAVKPFPPLFRWLQGLAGPLPDDDMLRTFNCGIGLVLVVEKAQATAALAALPEARTIGALVPAKEGEPRIAFAS
mmetsp:Transcript_11843/g.35574  ORF Transcript_11843/g.35574 Transcript_11843/m.35574 type:complete len:1009 (+) Transcript_11843:30-3056(+)